MKVLRNTSLAALIAAALSYSIATARAADSAAAETSLPILRVIPEDVLTVAVVNRIDTVDAKVGKLAAEFGVPFPGVLASFKATYNGLEGLDEKGSAATVKFPKSDGTDGAAGSVMFIPTTDYKKLISAFKSKDDTAAIVEIQIGNHPAFVARKGNFALLTEKTDPEDRKLLERALADSTGISAKLAPLTRWIAEHDAWAVATTKGVKLGLADMRKGLASMTTMGANAQTKAAVPMLDAIDGLLKRADREITTFAVGGRVDEDGSVRIESRALWIPDGEFAASAKELRHPKETPMAGLPAGPFLIAFDGELPEAFSKNFMNMSVGILNSAGNVPGATKLTEEQSKKLTELTTESMVGIRSMALVMGIPKPGESIYGGMTGLFRVENAKKYLDHYEKSMNELSELRKTLNNPLISQVATEVKRMTIEGLPSLEVTADMSKTLVGAQNSAAKKLMESWLGKDGKLTFYLAAADDKTVLIGYVSKANLSRVISAHKIPQTSLSADPDVAETTQMLWPEVQWVGYLDPKGLMDFSMLMAMQAAPPGAIPQLPTFPATPPIGLAVAMTPDALNAQLVLPAKMIRGYGSFVRSMGQLIAPQPPRKGPGL
jgi:hypothetical protein